MVARVNIGQIVFSVRSREANKATVIEALRRSKYKFPGKQKIVVSKKWGFTDMSQEQYIEARREGKVHHDGNHIKYVPNKGTLENYFEASRKARAL